MKTKLSQVLDVFWTLATDHPSWKEVSKETKEEFKALMKEVSAVEKEGKEF